MPCVIVCLLAVCLVDSEGEQAARTGPIARDGPGACRGRMGSDALSPFLCLSDWREEAAGTPPASPGRLGGPWHAPWARPRGQQPARARFVATNALSLLLCGLRALCVCLLICVPSVCLSVCPEKGSARTHRAHRWRRAGDVPGAEPMGGDAPSLLLWRLVMPCVSVSAGLALGDNCFLGRNHGVYRQGRGGAEKRRVLVYFPPAVGEVMRHMVDANSPPALLGQRTLAELLREGLELEPSGGPRPGRGRELQALRAQGLRPLGTEGERERHPHVEMFAAGAA